MPRLFFVVDIGDIQRLQAQYASECKVPNERGKVWRGFASRYWDLKLNLCLLNNLRNLIVRYDLKLLKKLLKSA